MGVRFAKRDHDARRAASRFESVSRHRCRLFLFSRQKARFIAAVLARAGVATKRVSDTARTPVSSFFLCAPSSHTTLGRAQRNTTIDIEPVARRRAPRRHRRGGESFVHSVASVPLPHPRDARRRHRLRRSVAFAARGRGVRVPEAPRASAGRHQGGVHDRRRRGRRQGAANLGRRVR